MKTKTKIVLCALLFFLGIISTQTWYSLNYPINPLFIEIINDTNTLIPSVTIEHGGNSLQEKITLVQLKPQESRTIALNHKPGMGFNIAVNYANGEKTEICGGKSKNHWFFRETITKFGIYSTAIR